MNVAEYILSTLTKNGVSIYFGYPGFSSLSLLRVIQKRKLRFVMCRSEQAAGNAAIGYMKATGKRAACIVSYGPGITNVMTSLAVAGADFVPLVVLAGGTPSFLAGTRSFQEINSAGLARSVAKYAARAGSAAEVPRLVERAVSSAYAFRPGPVFVDIPQDLLDVSVRAAPRRLKGGAPGTPPRHKLLTRSVKLFEKARRPVLILGSGTSEYSREVRRFVSTFGVPVVHTLGGVGVVPDSDSLSGGLLRQNGSQVAASLVQRADLILALGTNLDRRATALPKHFAPKAAVIRVDLAKEELQRNIRPTVAVRADAGEFLRELAKELLQKDLAPWQNELAAWKEQYEKQEVARSEALNPRTLIKTLAKVMPLATVVSGSGEHKYWTLTTFPFSRPRQFVASARLGAMGFGIPGAIGAALGTKGPVVLIVGDGDAAMMLAELDTVREQNLKNLYIVVMNNGALGSTYNHQERRFGKEGIFSTAFTTPMDFCAAARAMGLEAHVLRSPRDLSKFSRRLGRPGPVLFDCRFDARVRIPVWTDPLNGSLDDISLL